MELDTGLLFTYLNSKDMYKFQIAIAYNLGDKKWFMFDNKPIQGLIRGIIIPTINLRSKKISKAGSELLSPDLHVSYEIENLSGTYVCDKKSYELFSTKELCVNSLL